MFFGGVFLPVHLVSSAQLRVSVVVFPLGMKEEKKRINQVTRNKDFFVNVVIFYSNCL